MRQLESLCGYPSKWNEIWIRHAPSFVSDTETPPTNRYARDIPPLKKRLASYPRYILYFNWQFLPQQLTDSFKTKSLQLALSVFPTSPQTSDAPLTRTKNNSDAGEGDDKGVICSTMVLMTLWTNLHILMLCCCQKQILIVVTNIRFSPL